MAGGPADVIVGTDVVFAKRLVEPLLQTIHFVSDKDTVVWLCLQVCKGLLALPGCLLPRSVSSASLHIVLRSGTYIPIRRNSGVVTAAIIIAIATGSSSAAAIVGIIGIISLIVVVVVIIIIIIIVFKLHCHHHSQRHHPTCRTPSITITLDLVAQRLIHILLLFFF